MSYYIRGDLNQMSIQDRELRMAGFNVGRSDVHPIIKTEEEYKEALTFIFKRRIEGWWNYKENLIQYDICTADEFQRALKISCSRPKSQREYNPAGVFGLLLGR